MCLRKEHLFVMLLFITLKSSVINPEKKEENSRPSPLLQIHPPVSSLAHSSPYDVSFFLSLRPPSPASHTDLPLQSFDPPPNHHVIPLPNSRRHSMGICGEPNCIFISSPNPMPLAHSLNCSRPSLPPPCPHLPQVMLFSSSPSSPLILLT